LTLFDLAKRNIARNIREYFLYLYSMTFSIVIYFIFISLLYNRDIVEAVQVADKIAPAFKAASILLFFFAASFIWYSNSYFTRKRTKEVALYALFGLEKKKIGKLLFYENLMIGMLALIIGITIGSLFSKLFSMILIKLMGFSIIVQFTISPNAIIHTFIAFLIIMIITSIHGYRLIYRFSLNDLFKADKKREQQPKPSFIVAVLSLALIGLSYYLILQPSDSFIWKNYGGQNILVSIIALIVGSYLFFRSLSFYLLKLAQKNIPFYYKGGNLISISHLAHRFKGNVLILTVISLLSTITLFVFGAIYSMYYNTTKITKTVYPISFIYQSPNKETDQIIKNLFAKHSEFPILFEKRLPYLKINTDLTAIHRFPDDCVYLLSESSYLDLANKLGIYATKTLKGNEAIAFYDGRLNRHEDIYTRKAISLANNMITISAYKDYALLNEGIIGVPLVVSDDFYQKLSSKVKPSTMVLYKIKNEENAKELSNSIEHLIYKQQQPENGLFFSSFYKEYNYGLQTYGLLIFLGGFLGLVFLLATGSMIYFKQLTEASNDKGSYKILKMIGISNREIRNSLAKQIFFIFNLPLFLAIAHSLVMFTSVSHFLQFNMIIPMITCISVYICIYAIYYVLTVLKYYKIVTN
jgi:putative ABC transport system permease protein